MQSRRGCIFLKLKTQMEKFLITKNVGKSRIEYFHSITEEGVVNFCKNISFAMIIEKNQIKDFFNYTKERKQESEIIKKRKLKFI